MNYLELKKLFTSYESNNPEKHLTAYITFSSFGPRNQETYSWESRTYVISSDNKAFQPRMGGYSIFGSCLDGSDQYLRLDVYMKDEQGGKNGWVAEDCCIVGYQVPDCDDCGVVRSRLFFFHQEALDHVLRHIAKVMGMDYELLRTDKAAQKRLLWDEYSRSGDDCDLPVEQVDAGDLWGIQKVQIYNLPDVLTGHE